MRLFDPGDLGAQERLELLDLSRSERNDPATSVVARAAACDQACSLQPIEPFGDGAGGHHRESGEFPRGAVIGFSRTTKCGENVELAFAQSVPPVDDAQILGQVSSNAVQAPGDYPLWGAVIRATPAGLLLLAVSRSRPSGSWWWKSAILGILNMSAFFALVYVAAQLLPTSAASVIMATSPVVCCWCQRPSSSRARRRP